MSKVRGLIILIILFIGSIALSFYSEEYYRKVLRYFYERLSQNKISFNTPHKYFHFASDMFVISFGLFAVVLSYLLYRQTQRQKAINLTLTVSILILITIFICYIDSSIKLIECTACDDGTRVLNYDDIKYDKIFVTCLIIALIPASLTDIKGRTKSKHKDSKASL